MYISGSPAKRNARRAEGQRITSFVLTVMLAAAVSFGFPLYPRDSDCNPAELQTAGCEHMGIVPNAGVSGAVVCCLLDCQDPGPTAVAYKMPLPVFKVVALNVPVTSYESTKRSPQERWLQRSPFAPPDTYLRNLALLI